MHTHTRKLNDLNEIFDAYVCVYAFSLKRTLSDQRV